ncbi:MAG: hypothetical protein AAFW83_02485 [Pseudomonadota bacterium]
MSRNFGLPSKPGNVTLRGAKDIRPVATLFVSGIFGIIGAMIAGISFTEARVLLGGLFHDKSLFAAVFLAGFGAWFYVWLVRPRFAAHFQPGGGDPFSDILRFYVKAACGLLIFLLIARASRFAAGDMAATLLLCASGGAGAAAAFQTVIAFVPGYDREPGA